ncbi:family 16 glycoside hydrolase [Flagellimonas meishanensis]|uniref:family 16 glycoside hydrolase n=1 Tax=Flagellimonas meishanensis TaxID=2873264 RepID=UPI001CA7424B|nr:family 16 glycoside hydrolase [[Muricauda] meishanensis]
MGQTIPLTEENWKIIDNENNQPLDFHTVNYKGMEALRLGRHKIAKFEGKTFKNFVLEMYIAGKAMPGVGFRAKDLWDYEFFYCRVFSGGKEDALQYVPVFNGAMPWQLYNAPVYETEATFKPEEWFHLKMEVHGNNMRVFIGGDDKPEMEVELLQHKTEEGAIFLKTSFAEAYFANIKIQELENPFSIKKIENKNTYLSNWEISEQLEGNIYSQRQYYQWMDNAKKEHTWKNIKADGNGIVNLAQYFDHPKESVFARTNIVSEVDKNVTLAFDYTQVLLIAINNQPMFFGRELDMHNFMRIVDGEEKIQLPLQKGNNELVFWIRSDDEWQENNPHYLGRKQAMNWGFVARLE